MSILERTDGKWGSKILIIPDVGSRQPKFKVKQWFFDKLVENIDCVAVLEELVKAISDNELTQAEADFIINKAIKQRAILLHENVSRLLNGTTSNTQYNYGSGEYEPKPPLGWGQ